MPSAEDPLPELARIFREVAPEDGAALDPPETAPGRPAHGILPGLEAVRLGRTLHPEVVEACAHQAAADPDGLYDRIIRRIVAEQVEDACLRPELSQLEALLETHARFRGGRDVPDGWYRQGDRLGPSVWAVDLDIFVELELLREQFDGLRGTTVVLEILGAPLEVDVPPDATDDEAWSFEGAGLVETEEDEVEEDDLDEDPVHLVGDLHVLPVIV